MTAKIRLGVLCGGCSAEHEVSLQSARNIVQGLNRERYELFVIGIDQAGTWWLQDSDNFLLHADDPARIALHPGIEQVTLLPPGQVSNWMGMASGMLPKLDIIFPVLHGPYGEGGTVQGAVQLADIGLVGPDVLAAAVCMNKLVTKRIWQAGGVPVADYLAYYPHENDIDALYARIETQFGLPCFVKSVDYGSSIGITRVTKRAELDAAVASALRYSKVAIVEAEVVGREFECAVLGNHQPQVSLPGEIITAGYEFYSYEAKYLDPNSQGFYQAPAEFPAEVVATIQRLCLRAYRLLSCTGMTRLDGFVTATGEVILSEANTIPGFTNISLYPVLWGLEGVSYSELLDRLVDLGLEVQQQQRQLQHDVGLTGAARSDTEALL